jgi:hypothetical protein
MSILNRKENTMMMTMTTMMNTFQGEVAEGLTVAQEDNTKLSR